MKIDPGKSLKWLFLSSLIGLWSAEVLAREPTDPLILQLGDRVFERRIAAERELLKHGAAGLEMLESGAQSADPEIRERSARLLNLMRTTAFLEQRDRVRDDPWTVSPELAPAWEVYQEQAGDSLESRNLYVQMIDEERELMLAITQSPETWTQNFERRCADLRAFVDRQTTRELQPASVLALLFLANHPDNRLSAYNAQTISSLLLDGTFSGFVNNLPPREKQVCCSLLSAWVVRSGRVTPANRLDLANKYRLQAGLVPALEIIANRHAVGASRVQLQNAVRFVSNYGTFDNMSDLEQLLIPISAPINSLRRLPVIPTEKPAPAGGASPDLQVSDIALLGLLQFTRQNPAEYGITSFRTDAEHRFFANAQLFNSDTDRLRALRQWQAWRTAHALQFAPAPVDASEGWAG